MTTATLNPVKTFKDLRVWQEGITLVNAVYRLCSQLPQDERYGLASQMKRAAISVPSNIAEGQARHQRGDYRRFLYIAIGSLAELETQIHIADDLELISGEESASVATKVDHVRAMLLTLAGRLK